MHWSGWGIGLGVALHWRTYSLAWTLCWDSKLVIWKSFNKFFVFTIAVQCSQTESCIHKVSPKFQMSNHQYACTDSKSLGLGLGIKSGCFASCRPPQGTDDSRLVCLGVGNQLWGSRSKVYCMLNDILIDHWANVQRSLVVSVVWGVLASPIELMQQRSNSRKQSSLKSQV